MISDAVILGVALACCFGTSDYLSKALTARVGFYRTTLYTLAFSGLILTVPMAVLDPRITLSYPSAAALPVVAFSTFVAFLLMYRGYQKGHLSVVSPTVNSFPVFTILFAIFVLRVDVQPEVLMTLVIVIVGIVLVSTNFSDDGSSSSSAAGGGRRGLTPGVPEALLAALFFALGFSLLGYADEASGFLVSTLSARLGGAVFGFVFGLASGQGLRPPEGRDLTRVLVMGLLEAGGVLFFSLALLGSGSLSALPIITTLGGMGVVFTVGYAIVLAKERPGPTYALGIAILIAGVGALLYLTA